MRHLLEVALFAVSGLGALFLRGAVSDYQRLGFQLALAGVYFLVVRGWIKSLPRPTAKVFRRNIALLTAGAILSIFEYTCTVSGLGLLVISVLIAFRARSYGFPPLERNDVPGVLQEF